MTYYILLRRKDTLSLSVETMGDRPSGRRSSTVREHTSWVLRRIMCGAWWRNEVVMVGGSPECHWPGNGRSGQWFFASELQST